MIDLAFHNEGTGKAVLLIHGFPMNSDIWDKFIETFPSSLRTVTIDLPGFGKSPMLGESFTLDDIAEIVIENLEQRGLTEIVPIGHSLGGYVVLGMVNKKPSLFPGFGLFHSTAFPDSQEKKESRNKVIEFIDRNGVLAFTSNFIPPLFSNPSHPDVPFVREMNMKTDKATVVSYTKAMRDRPDRSDVLRKFKKPILLIAGGKDPGIPLASIQEQANSIQFPVLKILPEQSHMGLIEDVQTTSAIVYDFAMKCLS
ncbi:MAG TPA: alpha/beta hydrolase [Cyclobacteriaceae bacterium]|nr:alpha/beta hydrolase [Cyclobacteriaceae bacterium]